MDGNSRLWRQDPAGHGRTGRVARTRVFAAVERSANRNAWRIWHTYARSCGNSTYLRSSWLGTIRLEVQSRDAFRETGEEKEVKAECG
jgi:hypothetical protein